MAYMNSRNSKKSFKKIPKFRSLIEEARFWDNHSLTDYYDFSKFKRVRFVLEKTKKEESLTFRLQTDLKEKLDNLSRKLGLSASSLIRMWTIEKLASF